MKNDKIELVEKKLPKLLIMGYGRHGKDTVCEFLASKFHFKFVSSSFFMAEKVIYPELKTKYGYKTVDECYADRHNHRAEWFDMIAATNKDDAATLGKAIFNSYDIYCGLRNEREFQAMKAQGVFDYSIWVDATGRGIPPEPPESCTVHKGLADIVLYNNGTLADLDVDTHLLASRILEHFNAKV